MLPPHLVVGVEHHVSAVYVSDIATLKTLSGPITIIGWQGII